MCEIDNANQATVWKCKPALVPTDAIPFIFQTWTQMYKFRSGRCGQKCSTRYRTTVRSESTPGAKVFWSFMISSLQPWVGGEGCQWSGLYLFISIFVSKFTWSEVRSKHLDDHWSSCTNQKHWSKPLNWSRLCFWAPRLVWLLDFNLWLVQSSWGGTTTVSTTAHG